MVALSVLFHIVAFAAILFLPESLYSRKHFPGMGTVYEVDLVELPGGGGRKPEPAARVEKKPESAAPKVDQARRIEEPRKEEKPLVVAKKTAEKRPAPTENALAPSEHLQKALERIQNKVKAEEHLQTAISRLEAKVGSPEGAGPGPGEGPGRIGGVGGAGGPMALYLMEVEQRIRSNWSYPVTVDSRKDLETIVVLLVKSDGAIQKVRVEKKSASVMFDQSVLKAVERSDPLPPFPETYKKSYEEIEINFNLKDLKG